MIAEVVPVQEHIEELVPRLREYDRFDLYVTMPPVELIHRGVQRSILTRTLVINDRVACVWGLYKHSVLNEAGYLWMLSTDLIEKYPIAFLRRSRRVVADCQAICSTVLCSVDQRHVASEKWLKWLGFKPTGVVTHLHDLAFHEMELKNVVR